MAKSNMGKNLEDKISWKILKLFAQKYTDDDIGSTLTIVMVRSNLLSGVSHGKSLWNL